MRISTRQMNQQGTNSILAAQAKLAKTQLQLSTGKRMVTPADDPRGASQVLALNQSLAVTNQYQRNFGSGRKCVDWHTKYSATSKRTVFASQ